jgi:hypothetical protein
MAVTRGGRLRRDFEWIAKSRGRKTAKVAIARKLLTLCYYGLRDGEIRSISPPIGQRTRSTTAARQSPHDHALRRRYTTASARASSPLS